LSHSDYRFIDRLLHRLALHFKPVAEISFDLDQLLVRAGPSEISSQKHVFVSGLARAGTTALMRRLHDSGQFRSLTYRDMPFVLAPNIWGKLNSISRRENRSSERTHGDGLSINFDSPESLDEVFWKIFDGDQYISPEGLRPHIPSKELIQKYVRYVNAILSTETPHRRYLSKNNNNILRLDAIQQAFSKALILIPFREPLQHAYSLLRQHRHFSSIQAESKFVLSYMTWLGHHEFGLGHRRFLLEKGVSPGYPVDSLNYWLALWSEVYSWLGYSNLQGPLFIAYEDLCSREFTWMKLAELAEIPSTRQCCCQFRLSVHPIEEGYDHALANRASSIYNKLLNHSRKTLYTAQI